MKTDRAAELTESYLNGNISWVRNELKKRGGKAYFAQIKSSLFEIPGHNEAELFERLMKGVSR